MVPSGSGNNGISSFEPVGGESLFESKSTSQMSSGNLKPMKILQTFFFEHFRYKLVYLPEVLLIHEESCGNTDDKWSWS